MPRAFTEVERDAIRAKLLQAGRDCFLRYGLKKTTIEDLTRPAGIAKASFYLFFDNKERLFIEVFLEEIPAMMERLMAASFGTTDDAREALILLMRAIVREMERNEISRILLDNPAEIEPIASAMDYEEILRRVAVSFAPIVEAIAQAQARGEIIDADPFQIVYSLGLVKLLAFNREHIPDALYEAMVELAPRILADGLTCPARRSSEAGDRP